MEDRPVIDEQPRSDDAEHDVFGEGSRLLKRGELLRAAEAFRAASGLHIDAPESAPAEAPRLEGDGADLRRLLHALEAPRLDRVSWWREASEAWRLAGQLSTSRACALRARRLAEQGFQAKWEDLEALSTLARPAAGPSSGALRPGAGIPGSIHPEPMSEKALRLHALFGSGDRARVVKKAEQLIAMPPKARDLTAIMLLLTGGADLRANRFLRVELWHDAGEHRAAVEDFIATIGGSTLAGWLSDRDALVGAYHCGMSLLATGDSVGAYACFRLAAQIWPEESARDTASSNFLERVQREAERLSWAEDLLDDEGPQFGLHPQGWRTLSWFADNGLAGRWLAYLEAVPAALELYPFRVSRAMAGVAARNGLFMPELAGAPRFPSRARHLPAPRALPVIRPHDRGVPSSNESAPAPELRPPAPLPLPAPAPASPAARFRVGFVRGAGLKHAEASLQLEPGQIGVALSAVADDRLFDSIARQLAEDGWIVIWLRRPCPSGNLPHAEPDLSRFIRIRPGLEVVPPARSWLADIADDDLLRRSIATRLTEAVYRGANPAVRACVNALLSRAHRGELWAAISAANDQGSREQAVNLVSDEADLSLRSPQDLRLAALLVNAMTKALELLRASLRTAWARPERGARNPGLLLDLPGSAPEPEALLSLLAVGSLLRSAERDAPRQRDDDRAPISELADDFDLNARRRPPASSRARMRELLSQAQRAEEEPPSVWCGEGIVVPGSRPRVCVLASETLGEEWPAIVAWIRSGRFARRHVLLGGCRRPGPSILRGDVVGGAALLLVGPLGDAERDLLRIASGAPLGEAAGGGDNEVKLVRVGRTEMERRQVILWPAAESNMGKI